MANSKVVGKIIIRLIFYLYKLIPWNEQEPGYFEAPLLRPREEGTRYSALFGELARPLRDSITPRGYPGLFWKPVGCTGNP